MDQPTTDTSAWSVALPDHHLAICGATDIGAKRAENQDTFVIADLRSGDLSNPCNRTEIPLSRQGILLLVCDGMGGAAAGDLAARIASDAIKQQLVGAGPEVAEHPNESLTNAVCGANGAVLAEAKAHPETRGMGTTCTAAIVLPDRLFIAQIGDSRAYLLHDGRLQLLTRDQTMADQLVEAGALRPEDVAHLPLPPRPAPGGGNPVDNRTCHLGGARPIGAIGSCSARTVCTARFPDQEIARILDASADINRVARELIQAALAAGGPDNVTVVVADCE